MSNQPHPRHIVAFVILFLLLLLTIGTGPIGLAVLIMVGIPIALLVGFGSMAHNGQKPR